ncbi:hypothetical protein M3B46_18390 [Sphingobacterium daejeonense]|uniref:hypothetical protein n=1 Tax=Sphingobacterium daejeonense TaxID=371142 RepID=UPI0021A9089C|nr:hypothetical protein [Sphingobacterium daejeonense]MCT1532978.1 hypothetical protein [Sphingobacterium daejeonense]
MEVLLSGLNSYLGKRAMSNLSKEDFNVHGIVRDLDLFKSRLFEKITATLDKVDLLRKGKEFDSFKIDSGIGLAIYITHVPTLGEYVNLNLELITLRNFIELTKLNGGRRIVYIARLMDKPYINEVEALLKASDITYTIVLKNLAIGKGSVLDKYMHQLINGKYLPYDKFFANVKFNPISSLDLLRWIYNVDWDKNFINETIEIGGSSTVTVQEMYRLYKKTLYPNADVKSILLPHFIMSMVFQQAYHIHKEDVIEFRRLMEREYPIDNTSWKNTMLFSFTPLAEVIKLDQ